MSNRTNAHRVADGALDKLPPYSLECERCAIAAMILDRDIATRIMGGLSPGDFFLVDHRIIFETIAGLIAEDRPVDLVILYDELKRLGKLDAIGGHAYLAQIVASLPAARHGIEYAHRVHEHALLRFLINLADDVTRRAHAGESGKRIAAEAIAELNARITRRLNPDGNASAGADVEGKAGTVAGNARQLQPTGPLRPMGKSAARPGANDRAGAQSLGRVGRVDVNVARGDREKRSA